MSGQDSYVKCLNLVQWCVHIGETVHSVSSYPPGGGVTAPHCGRLAIKRGSQEQIRGNRHTYRDVLATGNESRGGFDGRPCFRR